MNPRLRSTASLLLLLPALGCSERDRVGVVDVQRAFQTSPLAMVSAHQVQGDLNATARDLKERGRALAEQRKQLEHGGLRLDDEQRAELESRLAQEAADLLESQRVYRAELEAARRRRGEEMVAYVEDVAREVAQREGLTLLLRTDGLVYAEDDAALARVDITDQVARALLEKINPTEIPEPPTEPSR